MVGKGPNRTSRYAAFSRVRILLTVIPYQRAPRCGLKPSAFSWAASHFAAWCEEHGQLPLPAVPETVAYYLTALAGTHKPATLQRRLTAITKAHQAAGYESPCAMILSLSSLYCGPTQGLIT